MIDITKLNNLAKARVLVVGDVMLDRYFNGDSQRISPEAPVPVVNVNKIEDIAGGAANVARNIAYLNGKAGLIGLIGDDAEGRSLTAMLAADGVESGLVSQPDLPTITKMRVISRHQQIVRLDIEQKFSPAHSQVLADKFSRLLANYDFVVMSDYNKGALHTVSRMIQVAKAAGKTVLVDPKHADFSVYRGADIITPNLTEFKLAGGDVSSDAAICSSARAMLQQSGIAAMVLTRSEQGMTLITADDCQHYPVQVLEVTDVTGAGDTVIATLAAMLAADMPLAHAVETANLAAGIVVAKLGTTAVTVTELAAKINKYLFSQGDIYQTPFDKVLKHIQFAKQNGERIVFTNGCFDILHAGHVRYLAQAKALGDRLVVGLNSDASISRLKGASRPINTLQDRATVLASLASVDWILPFGDIPSEQDTPLELILMVQPDVLVKGGDYSIETIIGAEQVISAGGEVKVLQFVDGCSTSAIIKKIQG
ncbi:bifunctional D-glycero-beta-D-manno-heptose-7-phosphate kinase/D-glycero-beta-D-manno-heptose 1-phosphate adenylyltransferase HldE [Rheinheimera salexigens]|uniref:Bifunctional protein HldE n=1 Tax=Rheinheimera salexigens TaxID=1628148 RepID=A0A1E7Q7L7_9GAMM|nr:bifunctional D-glycero-beta-D-manno-heptose-7-phosphate kinase/D-glycero-beta-D-manno-heptose 1-phosphate adenylyltransferase HldE [Rheinheimera salexigens]OEY70175.1 bifunctional heptose 7-phosphate kinase/heptose 1-phosphate adenyltransferase [Rheinheimera salexigens]